MKNPAAETRPSFLCIGAQKAGTTWLYQILRQHPQLWLPVKEVHYFDILEIPLPKRLKLSLWPTRRRRSLIRSFWNKPQHWKYLAVPLWDDWYFSLFSEANGRLAGDMTPAYSALSEASIERVQQLLPKAKIILMLRDPIERAWSQLRQHWAEGRLDIYRELDVLEVTRRPKFRRRSDCLGILKRWAKYYSPTQIKVAYFDDILRRPRRLADSLFDFLGVAPLTKIRGLKQPSHVGAPLLRPQWITRHLSQLFREELEELALHLGGWPRRWADLNEVRLSTMPGSRRIT